MANKHRLRPHTLTQKMVVRLLEGLAVGLFVWLFLYFGSLDYLKGYFVTSGYLYDAEISRAQELQNFVRQNELSTEDTDVLQSWAKERRISVFQLYQNEKKVIDLSPEEWFAVGAHNLEKVGWVSYYTITFSDRTVQVTLYEGAGIRQIRILLALSILIGFISCLLVFISGLQSDVRYAQCLRNEIAVLTSGKLGQKVTVRGEDELAQLAAGLDQMRLTLLEKERKENEMRAAQKKMVLGMSHDLKTPLTGLLAYMEILKRQQRNGERIEPEYLEKAYNQIIQLRNLSNRMFEYFLIDSHENPELEDPEEAESVLGDYLSEFCALLSSLGFTVDASNVVWKSGCVTVNTDYIGRIINNLVSNLEKYADRAEPVRISVQYEGSMLCLVIRNKIQSPGSYVEGTGIGTKNIAMMMNQMGGSQEILMNQHNYVVRLYFPIAT